MVQPDPLPPVFLAELGALEASYLERTDPIGQSGFGGAERWRAEREPILEAITEDGDLLDVGCANGYLLECLVAWGRERGLTLTPYGVDQGARLIALARERQPRWAGHFFVGNAWDWHPPRRFRSVYALLDLVPPDYGARFLWTEKGRLEDATGRAQARDYEMSVTLSREWSWPSGSVSVRRSGR